MHSQGVEGFCSIGAWHKCLPAVVAPNTSCYNTLPHDQDTTCAKERQRRSLLTALAAATAPITFSLPVAFLLANVLMDKTSLMGVLPPPLGPAVPDIIIAAIIGLSTVLAAGSIGVWWGVLLPRRKRQVGCCRIAHATCSGSLSNSGPSENCMPNKVLACMQMLVGALAAVAICTTVVVSLTHHAYSEAAPKRILAHHVFQQQSGNSSTIESQQLVLGGSDVVRIDQALDLRGLQHLPTSHRSWQVTTNVHSCNPAGCWDGFARSCKQSA
jgi:hypothetical protein